MAKSTNTTGSTVYTTSYAPASETWTWIENILNTIPLPRWAICTLAAGTLFLVLLVITCICCYCCKRQNRKKKEIEKIKFGTVKKSVSTGLVQPDVKGLKKLQENENRGRPQQSSEYNFRKAEITISVKQAAMDTGGISDQYVKQHVTNDTGKKNETKMQDCKTLSPSSNKGITFKSQIPDAGVVMQVFGLDRHSKHDTVGEVHLSLQNINFSHIIEQWKDLGAAGTSMLSHYGNLREICLSLKYIPVTSKLIVVILEGRKLKMDNEEFSDPYVKVQLALNKRKWKKKKTRVKKNTPNPYFNEEFTFDVSLEQIQNVDLIISVWDYDKINKNKQIGKIFLGCRASGKALRHWSDMLSHPRRPIAEWHALQPAEEVDKALGLKPPKKIPLPGR